MGAIPLPPVPPVPAPGKVSEAAKGLLLCCPLLTKKGKLDEVWKRLWLQWLPPGLGIRERFLVRGE